MKLCRALPFLLVTIVALVLPSAARGDGLIIITDGPAVVGHFPFAPLEVSFHHVDVEIDDPVAVTKVDQEFYNPNPQRLEGTYMFPLPEGAHVDKFSMDIDGKQVEAELLSADRARSIYEDIVRRTRDPALLEYVGRGALKCRIFPIEPNSKKRIKLQYTQLLKADSGMVEYTYPLNTEKFSSKPLHEVAIKVAVTCKQPMKSIYSPSHNIDIHRDGEKRAVVGYEERNVRPDIDFKLIFSRNDNPVGVDLLTYKTSDTDGYFLLLASPGMSNPTTQKVQERDVCFVLDTSGSMAGPKLEQAKKALLFCLANLNPGDRFNIVRFSTEAESAFDGCRMASKENVDEARKFVENLKPIGGTAISSALEMALGMKPSLRNDHDKYTEAMARRDEAPYVVIFLTDGQPTIGDTNEDSIVAKLKSLGNTRIFSFGVGTDVNTHLLDRIAGDSKAFSQYVLPNEDIEVKVSSFYSKISQPILANVAINFTGDVKVSQLYPVSMPDLFKGETLTVFGKYSTNKPGTAVEVTGTLNGEKQKFSADVDFSKSESSNSFIPRLWATRRVGWLLDEIRLHGESSELKDEVVRLSREHGIVTPYTAYLIVEDEARRQVPMTLRTMRELGEDRGVSLGAQKYYDSSRKDSPQLEKAGERAVANSAAVNGLKDSTNVQQSVNGVALAKAAGGSSATTQPAGYRYAQNYAQQVRLVNGKTFYQNGSTWSDSGVQAKQNLKRQQVKFNSDEYFVLLKKDANIPAWLSLGNELDVVIDDVVYEIR